MGPKGFMYAISISAVTISSCKKPYTPTITASNVNYLVVEGVINAGQDSTIIKLSRTVNIAGNINAVAELGAHVAIESNHNISYPLQETGNGNYTSSALNLDITQKYHLRITTSAGKEYLSDFESTKPNPPIDSVGFIVQDNGIQLHVNTHDSNNNTRYYRWEYKETWQFNAKYAAQFITDGTKLNYRLAPQQIYGCFGNNASSDILLGSTASLSKDIIYQQPVTQIASNSEKLERKYSILIKQYALTSNAYSFWQNLKKNSEQLGTIFAPLPSEAAGNIHYITTPSEPVIGYVSVTNIQQKRIFISNSQLPRTWVPDYPYQCELDSMFIHRHGQNDVALFLIPIGSKEFAIATLADPGSGTFLGYLSANAECADCTIRGTTKQPDFWR